MDYENKIEEGFNGALSFLKAQLIKKLKPSFEKGIDLRSLSSTYNGDKEESSCRALLKNIPVEAVRLKLENYSEEGFVIRTRGKNVEIIAVQTEDVPNPISSMMAYLKEFVFSKEEINQFIEFYNKYIEGSVYKKALKVQGVYLDIHTIKINMEMEGAEVIQSIRASIDVYDIGIVKINEENEPITEDTLTSLTK